jgi:hypothetical protein
MMGAMDDTAEAQGVAKFFGQKIHREKFFRYTGAHGDF